MATLSVADEGGEEVEVEPGARACKLKRISQAHGFSEWRFSFFFLVSKESRTPNMPDLRSVGLW